MRHGGHLVDRERKVVSAQADRVRRGIHDRRRDRPPDQQHPVRRRHGPDHAREQPDPIRGRGVDLVDHEQQRLGAGNQLVPDGRAHRVGQRRVVRALEYERLREGRQARRPDRAPQRTQHRGDARTHAGQVHRHRGDASVRRHGLRQRRLPVSAARLHDADACRSQPRDQARPRDRGVRHGGHPPRPPSRGGPSAVIGQRPCPG